jgi:TolA-binding protein
MRLIAILCLFLVSLMTGCEGAGSQAPPVSAAKSKLEADRVLAIAHELEEKGETKKAFAAYHQIVRNFPETPSGRKALERITKAQREASRKPRTTRN